MGRAGGAAAGLPDKPDSAAFGRVHPRVTTNPLPDVARLYGPEAFRCARGESPALAGATRERKSGRVGGCNRRAGRLEGADNFTLRGTLEAPRSLLVERRRYTRQASGRMAARTMACALMPAPLQTILQLVDLTKRSMLPPSSPSGWRNGTKGLLSAPRRSHCASAAGQNR